MVKTYKSIVMVLIAVIVYLTLTMNKLYSHQEKEIHIPFCIDLDELDRVSEILHWEVIDKKLTLYTKSDSIRDERERWEYIRGLDPEGWE